MRTAILILAFALSAPAATTNFTGRLIVTYSEIEQVPTFTDLRPVAP